MGNELAPRQGFGRRADMFIRFLSECGIVIKAAQACGLKDAQSMYELRRKNPAFRTAWQEAQDQFGDTLEAEAIRRAKDGVLKDVYFKGEVVGQEVVYSDGLMSKLLDGAKPEKYKPAAGAVTANLNVKVGIAVLPAQATSLEDWERESIELHKPDYKVLEETVPGQQLEQKRPLPAIASTPLGVKV